MITIHILSIVLLFLLTQGLPNDMEGRLVYYKLTNDFVEFVEHSENEFNSITLPRSSCIAVSPDGENLAIKGGDEIRLIRISDESELNTFPVSSNEENCNLRWYTSQELIIGSDEQRFIFLNTVTGNINEEVISPSYDLPFHLSRYNPILDPSGRYAVYYRCPTDNRTADGLTCRENGSADIFDLQNGSILTSLICPSDIWGMPMSEPSDLYPFPSFPEEAFWSHSGRFLLYSSIDLDNPIRIFDTQSNAYIESTAFAQIFVSFNRTRISWSVNENLIGLWSTPAGIYSGDIPLQFSIFDVNTATIENYPTQVLEISNWAWSPDDTAIAFVTSEQTLSLLDFTSSQITLLDEGVSGIIAWTP